MKQLIYIVGACLAAIMLVTGVRVVQLIDRGQQYRLSERCARSALVWIRDITHADVITDYTYHYSRRFNACFVLGTHANALPVADIKQTGVITAISLYNVNEDLQVGHYLAGPEPSKTIDCKVGPVTCRSREQWDALIKPYTEQ